MMRLKHTGSVTGTTVDCLVCGLASAANNLTSTSSIKLPTVPTTGLTEVNDNVVLVLLAMKRILRCYHCLTR